MDSIRLTAVHVKHETSLRVVLLEGDEKTARIFADCKDLADEGVVESGRGERLATKALMRNGVVGEVRRQDLQRGTTIELGIVSEENFPIPPAPMGSITR